MDAKRKDTNLKEVYKISGLMVIGMAVGLYLFNLLPWIGSPGCTVF